MAAFQLLICHSRHSYIDGYSDNVGCTFQLSEPAHCQQHTAPATAHKEPRLSTAAKEFAKMDALGWLLLDQCDSSNSSRTYSTQQQ
jgi:hypothetical protein